MYPNPLKQKLRNGELVLGTALDAPSASVTVLSCQADIDFLWIDTEHQPFGSESIDLLPVLARQRGVAPLIRVAWNDPALIKKAYDVGAVAVMVPQVNTAEEAKRAVEYAFYPPKGQRGVAPNWPLLAGEDFSQIVRTANEETVLILQIESQQAYDNLDEITKVPGIDCLFVGPLDLSASLGVITQQKNPAVEAILRDVPRRLAHNGIVAGTLIVDMDMEEMHQKIEWGYRFINLHTPLSYGVQTLKRHLADLRKGFLS